MAQTINTEENIVRRNNRSVLIVFIGIFCAAILVGCASSLVKGYSIGKQTTVSKGRDMIWWSPDYDPYRMDGKPMHFKRLAYSGLSGSTITISYGEYEIYEQSDLKETTQMHNTKELTYDILANEVITFQNIQMLIVSVDSSAVSFTVLAD